MEARNKEQSSLAHRLNKGRGRGEGGLRKLILDGEVAGSCPMRYLGVTALGKVCNLNYNGEILSSAVSLTLHVTSIKVAFKQKIQ